MIDHVTLFTQGGVVLWYYTFSSGPSAVVGDLNRSAYEWGENPDVFASVNSFIQNVFLGGKLLGTAGQSNFTTLSGQRRLWRWDMINELKLVFLVVYEATTPAGYVERLVNGLKRRFLALDPERQAQQAARPLPGVTLDAFTGLQTRLWLWASKTETQAELHSLFVRLLNQCDRQLSEATRAGPSDAALVGNSEEGVAPSLRSREPKKDAVATASWNTTRKITKQAMRALDFSKDSDGQTSSHGGGQHWNARSADPEPMSSSPEISDDDSASNSESEYDAEYFAGRSPEAVPPSGFFGRIASALQSSWTGKKVLCEEDVDCILSTFQQTLMEKNVASDIVEQLMTSVKACLLGTKTESFTSVRAALKKALRESMQRILTHDRCIDVLKAAQEAKQSGRVYSICFLGINGVGKSTSLAKVAYYLKHRGQLQVMIAACDTFRAGAVEQLETHARNLNLHVFQQGYGKDASMICRNALRYANAEGYDVVLIDTAGRMQDNESLMRPLAKLVAVNRPDLVLFVGEALVGNDGTDQLVKFSRSLIDYAPVTSETSRGIDGIILTKFDTVDDKVGAALSMSYILGQPIVFVGTGQKYTDLQTLKVNHVLKALLG